MLVAEKHDVDLLGQLLAQIDSLTKQAESIKKSIKEEASLSGQQHFDGELFRATYSESNVSTVNWKALAAELAIPARSEEHTSELQSH